MNDIKQTSAEEAGSKFLRNAWYMAGWRDAFSKTGLASVSLLDEPIVLYQAQSGDWVALRDACCHRLVPLSIGRREGDDIRCMYHGLKFARDGRCIEIPGQLHISQSVCVRSYPAIEKHGAVWIWMGDPARADSAQVPPIPAKDNFDYEVLCSAVDVDGDARLVWDNLLDLTHIPFVHANSFGGGNPASIKSMLLAETEALDITSLPRGVRTERWHYDKPSYTFLGGGACDDHVVSDFIAPGVLIVHTRSYKPGAQRRHSGPIPDEELVSIRGACQVVTPVSSSASRIHFSLATWLRGADVLPAMLALVNKVLAEDKCLIEAQQTMMKRLPRVRPMRLAMDVPASRFKGIMEGLLMEENAPLMKP